MFIAFGEQHVHIFELRLDRLENVQLKIIRFSVSDLLYTPSVYNCLKIKDVIQIIRPVASDAVRSFIDEQLKRTRSFRKRILPNTVFLYIRIVAYKRQFKHKGQVRYLIR